MGEQKINYIYWNEIGDSVSGNMLEKVKKGCGIR